MKKAITFDEMKKKFPGEWVLVGNPVTDITGVNLVSGIPIFHCKNKSEFHYIGEEEKKKYHAVQLVFTRTAPSKPRRVLIGIFNSKVR